MKSRWLLAILLVNCMRPRQCCSEWLYGITVFEVQTFEPNDEATGPLVQWGLPHRRVLCHRLNKLHALAQLHEEAQQWIRPGATNLQKRYEWLLQRWITRFKTFTDRTARKHLAIPLDWLYEHSKLCDELVSFCNTFHASFPSLFVQHWLIDWLRLVCTMHATTLVSLMMRHVRNSFNLRFLDSTLVRSVATNPMHAWPRIPRSTVRPWIAQGRHYNHLMQHSFFPLFVPVSIHCAQFMVGT